MGLGPCPSTPSLPHQPEWPSLKAVTTGTKTGWFQQLVDTIGQATLKGQVPLHNVGIIITHYEFTLQVDDMGHMRVTAVLQPPCARAPASFPLSNFLSRLTGRAGLQAKEMGVPCMVRSGPRLGRSDAKA